MFLLGVFALFFELGDCRSLGSHEAYIAVPVREMLETGDFIVPRFGGLPRLEKPPLGYWVCAASAWTLGELSEWTLRIPAALSGIALAILMGIWAKRWYGSHAGWGAAIAQLTAVYVIVYARKAEVDMLLCLLTTSAMFLIAHQSPEETGRKGFIRWIGIYALLAAAWMAKFHYGVAMILAPAITFYVLRGRYRQFLQMLNPVGLFLIAAAALIWPYLVMQQVPEAMELWKQETVGRATGELGYKPVWFYLPPILWMMLPWTPFALAAAPASLRRAWRPDSSKDRSFWKQLRDGDAREQFLWVWFFVSLCVVTVQANKHRHYIMSALPLFSLLAGQRFAELVEWSQAGRRLLKKRVAIPLTVACLALAIGTPIVLSQRDLNLPVVPSSVVAVIAGLGACVAVWLMVFQRNTLSACTAGLVFMGCLIGVHGWILRHSDHRMPFSDFAQILREGYSDDREILVYRMGYHSMMFYMEPPVTRIDTYKHLAERLQKDGSELVVAFEPNLAELKKLGNIRDLKVLDLTDRGESLTEYPIHLVELTPLPSVQARKAAEPESAPQKLTNAIDAQRDESQTR